MIFCKTCLKQYTENSEELRAGFNNYRCAHRNCRKNRKVKQELFYTHFADDIPSDELDTFQPNGLNESEVALFLQ